MFLSVSSTSVHIPRVSHSCTPSALPETLQDQQDGGSQSVVLEGDLQDGGGVRRGDHLPPHKYITNTSTCGTTNSYRAPTERWQKTSDFQKGKEVPRYLTRAKEKRKKKGDKGIRMGHAPLGGSCEGGTVSTH